MFAQLLITLTLTWIVAEVLCRLFLQGSVVALARELFVPASVVTEEMTAAPDRVSRRTTLRRQLGERRRELKDLEIRLAESRRTAEVEDQLAATEAEMARLEDELAELEGGLGAPP